MLCQRLQSAWQSRPLQNVSAPSFIPLTGYHKTTPIPISSNASPTSPRLLSSSTPFHPPPPLYAPSSVLTSKKKQSTIAKTKLLPEDLHALRQKKAWDIAFGPAKQLPMQGFMMYMSGSGVQIFSVMTTYMLIKNAVAAMFAVSAVFQPYEPPITPSAPTSSNAPVTTGTKREEKPYDLTIQKLAYLVCQGLLLALGMWKIRGMGLIPNWESDWVMYTLRPPEAERALRHGMGVIFN